jgi:HD domain
VTGDERGWPKSLAPPRSAVAESALSLCVQASPPFLANHAVRTFAWACLLAQIDDVLFDRETLYVASLLHDLGLTSRFEGPRCFELRSADAARDFASREGWDLARALVAAEAIRLHMQARVVRDDGPEAYLLSEATSLDVSGRRFEEVDQRSRELVLTLAPRAGFREGFAELFRAEAEAKPGCMADLAVQDGLLDRISAAPFPDE